MTSLIQPSCWEHQSTPVVTRVEPEWLTAKTWPSLQDAVSSDTVVECAPKSFADGVPKTSGGLELVQGQIARHIRYYFSPANLQRDEFLLTQLGDHAIQWVKIEMVAAFIPSIQALTNSMEIVIEEMKNIEELIVHEDELYVRRISPFYIDTTSDEI